MTSILRVDSSAAGAASVTNELTRRYVEGLLAVEPTATVTERDTTVLPVLDEARLIANNTPTPDRTPEQSGLADLGDELIAELEAADVVVIGAPIYNFGVPASLKAWFDHVARAGRTFNYTENGPVGLVTGKRAVVVVASGGVPIDSPFDWTTGHLRTFLGFLGFTDVAIVDAASLNVHPENLDVARARIDELAAV